MTVQATAVKAELETAIEEIWQTANDAERSRSGMQDALDQIQELCSGAIPDVEDRVAGIEDDDEDDETD